jgi:hypothetical protein
MKSRPLFLFLVALALAPVLAASNAATRDAVHGTCSIRIGEKSGSFRLRTEEDCGKKDGDCGMNFSEESVARFTGITPESLSEEGDHLTATLGAESGSFSCSGVVHAGALIGDAAFLPSDAFVGRMEQMGFSGLDTKKLELFAFFDVTSAWAQSLKEMGIDGLNTEKLVSLAIFHVDKEYVRSITSLGYELPSAEKLVELRVQGVDAAEVREMRGLGFQPNLDDLIQIRIFRITPDFVHRMQERGFKNLTLAKLVQIRIFNLAD